jgi:membrane protein DedA with SNARE-associated domain
MNETSQFLMRHGLSLVFVAVLVEQMGVPIPAVPLLLTVGALSATRVRPLLGGINAWREGNHRMEVRTQIITGAHEN